MCIIAAKPRGVEPPKNSRLETMWDNNPDGAGFMYAENGSVQIHKGFMTYETFKAAYDKFAKTHDVKNTAVVFHFRIATHGGVKPECTHPFPITDSLGKLRKLTCRTNLAVAHNGVINSVSPDKEMSDTMEYIATQLAPLYAGVPKFYMNEHLMQMVQNATESKLAFMTNAGDIYTVGKFEEKDGMLFSNGSYGYTYISRWRGAGMGYLYSTAWDDYGSTDDTYITWKEWKGASAKSLPSGTRKLMWLTNSDPASYAIGDDGNWCEGEDLMLDRFDRVWLYDYDFLAARPVKGAWAFNADGMPMHFDEELADDEYVLPDDPTDFPVCYSYTDADVPPEDYDPCKS